MGVVWHVQQVKVFARACLLFPFVQKDIPKTCIFLIGNKRTRHLLCTLKCHVSNLSNTKSKGSNMTGVES